jgi:hypothetical protein
METETTGSIINPAREIPWYDPQWYQEWLRRNQENFIVDGRLRE